VRRPPPPKDRPEDKIVQALKAYLRTREWLVKKTHGSEYQSGFPDLFCAHKRFGIRWVEVKVAKHGRFTPAQIETFREFAGVGVGVWVLVGATEEEYQKLFHQPNWWAYCSEMREFR
jgi:hypothetical protein